LNCPKCKAALQALKHAPTFEGDRPFDYFACTGGHGRGVRLSDLAQMMSPLAMMQLQKSVASARSARPGCQCPQCAKSMNAILAHPTYGKVELDVCLACHLLWCDPGELEAIHDRRIKTVNLPRDVSTANKALGMRGFLDDSVDIEERIAVSALLRLLFPR